MATLLAVVIGAGFTPTFYARGAFFDVPPLSCIALLHGAAGTAWLALFVVQAWLVVAGRRDWHRQLGVAGVVLAPLFVVSGIGVIAGVERSTSVRLGHDPGRARVCERRARGCLRHAGDRGS